MLLQSAVLSPDFLPCISVGLDGIRSDQRVHPQDSGLI